MMCVQILFNASGLLHAVLSRNPIEEIGESLAKLKLISKVSSSVN